MRFTCILTSILLGVATLHAQTAGEHIALGDRDYIAMNAVSALSHYEQAYQAEPSSYEAAWKASRSAIDIGSYATELQRQNMLFSTGEQYARRALALNPGDPEGHFSLARALGKTALHESRTNRIKYATEIRSQALTCLKLNPKHAGCLHVMGMWNAEVMRLNSFARLVARNFLGGQIFGTANWKEAVRYMEAAVAAEPDRIVHHLDLGEVYRDVGSSAKAKAEFELLLRLPVTDVNDQVYKNQARNDLSSL
jgi:tetratricopeptide (TPR) repeat protein